MSRALALTMRRPHEAFGMPMTMGRRLNAAGRTMTLVAVVSAFVACLGLFVYQAHIAATQSFATRALEKRLESLQETVAVLENQAAQIQTIQAVQDKIQTLGYIPVEHMEFVNISPETYALAK